MAAPCRMLIAGLSLLACACAASQPTPWPARPRLCFGGEILMADRPGEHHYQSYTYKVVEEFFFHAAENRMVERQQVYSGEQVVWQTEKGLPLVFSMRDTPAVFEYRAEGLDLEIRGATASGVGALLPGAGWTRWSTELETGMSGYWIASHYRIERDALDVRREHYVDVLPCMSLLPGRLPIAVEKIRARQVGVHECQRVFDGASY